MDKSAGHAHINVLFFLCCRCCFNTDLQQEVLNPADLSHYKPLRCFCRISKISHFYVTIYWFLLPIEAFNHLCISLLMIYAFSIFRTIRTKLPNISFKEYIMTHNATNNVFIKYVNGASSGIKIKRLCPITNKRKLDRFVNRSEHSRMLRLHFV